MLDGIFAIVLYPCIPDDIFEALKDGSQELGRGDMQKSCMRQKVQTHPIVAGFLF